MASGYLITTAMETSPFADILFVLNMVMFHKFVCDTTLLAHEVCPQNRHSKGKSNPQKGIDKLVGGFQPSENNHCQFLMIFFPI